MSETTPANVNHLDRSEVSQGHLETVLSSIKDLIITLDRDWRYTYINHRMLELSGMTREDFLGKCIWDLFPDAVGTLLFEEMHRAAAEQQPIQFDYFYTAWNQWFECRVYPLENGVSLLATEITARKQAEHRRDIQYAIARVLAEATTTAEALPAILQALCQGLAWQLGVIWSVQHQTHCLHYSGSWHLPTFSQTLVEANQQTTFAPGVGLPGRVWMTHQPLWIADLSQDTNFPRAIAAVEAGLQTAFGFPILLGHQVLGVIECFSDRVQDPDEDLLNMMAAIGSQIGQFMERKRAEAALRESQDLFRSFMNNSPVTAFIKDELGRYIYVNPRVEQVLQRSQEDVVGKTDFELLPTHMAESLQVNDDAVLHSGQVLQTLETIQSPAGEREFMSFKFPFCNASGEQLLAGVAIDITEQQAAFRDRSRTEEELRQREAELRLITNAVPVLISFIDAEQRYRFNNERYEEWFGKSPAEVNGKYLWEVLGAAAYELVRPYVEQVLTGHQVTFESKVPYPRGGIRDVVATYVPRFDAQEKVIGFVALVSDISQRKRAEETLRQSEERLRIAQQAANAGVWDWDIVTNQVSWSEEYYQLYGLDPATTAPGYETWLQSIVEQDRDRVDQAARQALEHRTDLNVEFRVLHPTRGERWITAIGQTFYDDQGQPKRMTGIALDITERKRFESALRTSEEHYRKVHDQVIVGISQADLTGQFMQVNERFCEIAGRSQAELLSLRMQDITHPDDLPHNVPLFQRMLSEGTSFEIEKRYIRPDGSLVWVRNYVSPIRDATGRPLHAVAVTEDITERKRVEIALAESNQTLQAIVQACPLAIMGLRSDGTVRIWNPAAERIFGWSQQEVLGQFLPAISEDRRDEFLNNIATTLQGQVLSGVETQRHKKDHTPIDVALWTAPVDEAQAGISCLSIVADISDRKRAEAALRHSEAFNRQILESSEDCIKVLDLKGLLLYMSSRGQSLIGINNITPFLGYAWVKFWQEAERPAAQEALNCAKSGGVGTFQGYCPTLAGEPKWWDVRLTPMRDADGNVERLLCISRDVTERKQAEAALRQSEERYRYLTQSIPQLVWTSDAEGVLLDVNQRWLAFTGLSLAQAQTAGWQAIVHPEDIPTLSQSWAIAQQNSGYYQAEGRLRRSDGIYRWHLHQAVPFKDEQGNVIKWFGTATDIEDQKQLEQQRIHLLQQEQAAREQAEAANRIKDEFLAVLSHELRSPLNPILGWARLLQSRTFDDATFKKAIETIERNARLQAQLIEDLLDVSRILRGKLSLNLSSVHLISTLEAALETVRLSADAKNVQIHIQSQSAVGPVLGDSARLQQVIWNLLSNAIKFTPEGGRVEVRLEEVRHERQENGERRISNEESSHSPIPTSDSLTYAQITVSDNGKGIAPDFLPYVFDYFRQADSTTTRKFGGLGLGLAIVRYLVELHGGTVQADSPGEGQGATFTVRLPLMRNPVTDPSLANGSTDGLATSPLMGLSILVVDDDPDTRDYLAFVLAQAGASVTIAASATEALQKLARVKPSILLSDIGMPAMDGYMLIRSIRTLPPEQGGQTIAIALTAYAGEMNQQQALAAGFQRHLSKPIDPDELIRAIAQVMPQSQVL